MSKTTKVHFAMLLGALTAALSVVPVRSSAQAARAAMTPDCNDTDPATIAKKFVTPPDSCRPWVYAFFLNGNITRGGITADLEAMKRARTGRYTFSTWRAWKKDDSLQESGLRGPVRIVRARIL